MSERPRRAKAAPKAAGPAPALSRADALRAINARDFGWLARQPEEARAGFEAWVMQRTLSAIDSREAAGVWLRLVNERANERLAAMQKLGGDAAFRLLASCGLGDERQHHPWTPPPRRGAQATALADPARALLARFHPLASPEEIDILLRAHTGAEFGEFARGCGVPPNEAQEAIRSYERCTGQKVPDEDGDAARGSGAEEGSSGRRRAKRRAAG